MSGRIGTIQSYVTIGTQNWQRRNLDVSAYRNGDIIPYVADATAWSNLTTGAWCWYNNNPELGKIYGKLYNWYAVNDPRGLAPEGWHVSTNTEWDTLTTFLGGTSVAGGALKSITGWNSPNTGATNSSRFSALPGGYRFNTGTFSSVGSLGFWWNIDEINTTDAAVRYIFNNDSTIYGSGVGFNKKYGSSVRCIKD